MKTEVIVTRGHLVDDSLEFGVLGHLSYSYGVPTIESRELIAFDFELDLINTHIVNQQFVPPVIINRTGIDYRYWRGQQFTTGEVCLCSHISIPLHKQNQPNGPLYIEIREVNVNGYPIGPTLGQIIVDPNNPNVPIAPTLQDPGIQIWTDWYFDEKVFLDNGMYCLFLWSTDTNYPSWRWGIDTNLGYDYGAFVYTNNGGVIWIINTNYDLPFIVHIEGFHIIGLEATLEIISKWEMETGDMIETTAEIDQLCISDPGGM